MIKIYRSALFALILVAPALAQTPSQHFSAPTGAGMILNSGTAAGSLGGGFAMIQADSGSTVPDGFAVFEYRAGGILVSEATMPEVPLAFTTGKRFFVEAGGGVNTAVAITNPNPAPATISFGFQDPAIRPGLRELVSGSFTLPGHSEIARFVVEAPFNLPAPYMGLMRVESSVPIAVTALRGLINERSDFLMTSLIQRAGPISAAPPGVMQPAATAGYIPTFVDGGGWTTEIVFVNDDQLENAFIELDFIGPSGEPVDETIDGQTASSFTFGIRERDWLRIRLNGGGAGMRAGYIRVIAGVHSAGFSGLALYSYKPAGTTVSMVSLPMVQPAATFRLFVEDSADSAGKIRTGVAISNLSSTTSSVSLELTDLKGGSTGLSTTVQIPPQGQLAKFLKEIPGFESLPMPFRGVLRVVASAPEGITVAALRGHLNERSDFLVSSVLPAADDGPMNTADEILPVVQGGGYSTEVVLFNGRSGTTSTGTVTSVSAAGTPLSLTPQ